MEYREAGSSQSMQKTWSTELQPDQNCRAALSHYGGKYLRPNLPFPVLHICVILPFDVNVLLSCRCSCLRAKQLGAQNSWVCADSLVCPLIRQELVSQRQKVREERERLQAQLEHFRRCLTLPNIHWGRGQVNGHMQRWPLTPTLWQIRLWQQRNGNENKTGWSQTTLSTWRSQSLSCYPSGQSVMLPDWLQI